MSPKARPPGYNTLSPRERQVYQKLFQEGRTEDQAIADLGISLSNLQHVRCAVRKKLHLPAQGALSVRQSRATLSKELLLDPKEGGRLALLLPIRYDQDSRTTILTVGTPSGKPRYRYTIQTEEL